MIEPIHALNQYVSWPQRLRPVALHCVLGLIAALANPVAAADQPRATGISVDGTILKVSTSDGRVIQGAELTGAVLTIAFDGKPVRARIASVEPDPMARSGEVLLYDLEIIEADGSERPLCAPDPDGRRVGFPIAGRTDETGALAPVAGFEFVCTSGAQGKCVRFGYAPWKQGPDGQFLLRHYNACVRMLRADYCGDGRSFTRDGTIISFADRIGINNISDGTKAFARPEELPFEASWNAEGAVCVARTRISDKATLVGLRAACPKIADRLGANVCSPAKSGGLLDNFSAQN